MGLRNSGGPAIGSTEEDNAKERDWTDKTVNVCMLERPLTEHTITLSHPDSAQSSTSTFPPFHLALIHVHQLLLVISLDSLWKGRLPLKEVEFQHVRWAYGRSFQAIGKDSLTWASAVINGILQEVLSLWRLHNSLQHGRTDEEQKATLRAKAIKRCQDLDTATGLLDPADADFFEKPGSWEKWPVKQMQAYLKWTKPLSEKCSRNWTSNGLSLCQKSARRIGSPLANPIRGTQPRVSFHSHLRQRRPCSYGGKFLYTTVPDLA